MITLLLDNDTVVRIESRKDIGDMVHAQILDENGALIDVFVAELIVIFGE